MAEIPIRTSGNMLFNGGLSSQWPSGDRVQPTCGMCGSCDECLAWVAGPGQGQAVGGWQGLGAVGYGYGAIGPNGPDRGNLPGELPSGAWWNTRGTGGSLIPAITRATQVIVSPVVRTNWRLASRGPLPQWIVAPMLAGKMFGPLLPAFPAPRRLHSHDFWSTLLTHALWWGRGAFIFQESEDGQPLAGTMRILNPFMVGFEGGRWVLDPGSDDPLVSDAEGGFRIGPVRWQMKLLRGLPPHDPSDDHFGGVLVRHSETFGIAAHIQSYSKNVFHQGIPAGVLKVSKPNFGQEDADALLSAWKRAHGGDRRGVAILNSTVDFSPVSLNPVETDLTRVHKASTMDVARAFGLSAAWLDEGGDSLTYANMVDRRRDLVDHTLAEWGASMMEVLTTILPAGQRLEINWAKYTSGDFSIQLDNAIKGFQAGLLTMDEARDLLDLGPLEATDG